MIGLSLSLEYTFCPHEAYQCSSDKKKSDSTATLFARVSLCAPAPSIASIYLPTVLATLKVKHLISILHSVMKIECERRDDVLLHNRFLLLPLGSAPR